MLLEDQRFVLVGGGVGDGREGLLPHPPENQQRPPPPWRAAAATEARPPPSGKQTGDAGWSFVACRSADSRPSCEMRTCAAATRWMGRWGYAEPQRGRGGEEAVNSTGGRVAGWSEKIAGAPRRRRRRRRHRRGSRRHSLPCAGARRALGRPLLTAASRRQHRQRRWPPPPPAARGCCGKGYEDRSAFNANTTPCLKTQKRRLLQGPQSPLLTNYRGAATSWPFVAASTCPHDPVSAAPALTYLLNHDSASADRTGDEDVATSSSFTERCGQPQRMFLSSRKRRGTSSNGVGSQTDRQKRF